MMSSLDDKILGEKLHYYCSSSESEDESEPPIEGETINENKDTASVKSGPQTGPKGVIEDWRRYKQLEIEKREACDKERLELIKKLSITCQSASDEEQQKNVDQPDDFIKEYRKKRMLEMLQELHYKSSFGTVFDMQTKEDFINAIDEEDKSVPVIIHVYDNSIPCCKELNKILCNLAKEYTYAKFCKILASTAGLSINFRIAGIPAFLVYKNKQIIGNFVRLTDELGDEIYDSDVENFFMEHGILKNKYCIPTIISSQPGSESD